MYLSDLIARLEELDSELVFPHGFSNPHSYRGDYYELAFEPTPDTKVRDMLADAKSSFGKTFEGYKGGEFTMGSYTNCYLANYSECGEELGTLLFRFMVFEARNAQRLTE